MIEYPMHMRIGFIGQGWIGKNYADYFEENDFSVVRYAREEPYTDNKEKIAHCDIVFIAVPTPSTPEGFDDSIVREVVKLVGKGKIAIIKSTVLPGTTRSIQKENQDIFIFHSPEFLREQNAREDVWNPVRNIIGIIENTEKLKNLAQKAMDVLPKSPYERICTAEEAELTKYGGNTFLFWKVVYMNMLYDMAKASDCNWYTIVQNMIADPRIGKSHMQPVYQNGRGASGHCFVKDFAAFSEFYERAVGDKEGHAVLNALRDKNNALLVSTGKGLGLLRGVYGDIGGH